MNDFSRQRTLEEIRAERLAALNLMEDALRSQEALRRNEERTRRQKEAFQALINGAPLADSLNILVRILDDELAGEARAAFYVADVDGIRLHPVWGAGTMPDSYLKEIDGFLIGKDSLACGLAVPTGEPVLTTDVMEEPRWKPWVHVAKKHDYRGCWSFPIKSRNSKTVGTLAVYWRVPREATPSDVALAEVVTQAAGVIIAHHTEAQERARAEQSPRESEARFRSMFTNNMVPMFVWTPEGEILDSNDGFLGLIGYTRKELEAGQCRWEQLTPPEERERDLKAVDEVRAQGVCAPYEKHFRHKDGHLVPFLVGAGIFDYHRFSGVCYAIDLSERKRAEEALRASEEQFRRAIEDAPIPVIMHAEDGQVLQISKTWSELTGYKPEDIPTFEAWLNHAYGPGANKVRDHVQRLFRGRTRQLGFEMDVTTRKGEQRRWAFSASAPGTLHDGRRYIVGMALDVTDRVEELREANKELRSLSKRLVEAQETERRRIAEALHDDIGQVLTGLNLILKRGRKKAPIEEIIQAESLVADLLDRVRHLSLNLRPHVLDNLGLAAALRWHVKTFSEQTKIHVPLRLRGITRDVAPELATTVFRVIQEALTNVARHAQATQAKVSVIQTASHLQVEVCDNGRGIDPNELRTASSGIANLRQRVRLSGGEFSLERNGASGTLLRATLPLASETASPASP